MKGDMNILVIRTHRLGDILQLTPMLRGLKFHYPESRIYFITGRDYLQLLQGNPHVDAVIPIPEKQYRYAIKHDPDKHGPIFNELYDLISELRGIGFDLIINRQYEWGAVLAGLVGAERILGGTWSRERGFYFDDGPSEELFEAIRRDRRANRMNLADWACRIALPASNRRFSPCFPIPESAMNRAAQRLRGLHSKDGSPPIAVHMGAAQSFRQWGKSNYAELLSRLIGEKRKTIVLTGGPEEVSLAADVCNELRGNDESIIDLSGKTGIAEIGAVLKQCGMLISGDTGPMHIAASAGVPVLALFYGPAYPWETGPYGPGHSILFPDLPCAPCLRPDACGEHRCKEMTTPEAVMQAFSSFEQVRSGSPVSGWDRESALKLLITAPDEKGHQLLKSLDAGDRYLAPDCSSNMLSLADSLILKSRDMNDAFLDGNPEQGFSLFSEYLEILHLIKKTLPFTPVMNAHFGSHLNVCLTSLQAADFVSIRDMVNHVFNPLLVKVFGQGQ